MVARAILRQIRANPVIRLMGFGELGGQFNRPAERGTGLRFVAGGPFAVNAEITPKPIIVRIEVGGSLQRRHGGLELMLIIICAAQPGIHRGVGADA